jgi:Zn-dependent M28 family amino/carboxypeptidase
MSYDFSKNRLNIIFTACLLLIFVFLNWVIFKKNFAPNEQQIESKPEIKEYTFEDAINSIKLEDCKRTMGYLASDELEGRMSGKKGNVLAAEFIKKELENYGLKTINQKFSIKRTNNGPKKEVGNDYTENVYGYIIGRDLPNEVVVVGAHFDHIGYGPRYSRVNKVDIHNGADDNASGTVAVLEVAEAFARLNPKRTVVFQFYSAEEMGLIGSRYYCDNPTFPLNSPNIQNHVAMINLDMVGHLDSKFIVSQPRGLNLFAVVDELSESYPFAKKVLAKRGGSDHVSFNNKKIPTLFIHTGSHKHYHTPTDDIETINFKGLEQIAKYTFELTWNLSNKDKPDAKEALFEILPYTHDHDIQSFE